MAGETTTVSMDDVVYAAVLTSEVLTELRPRNVMRQFLRMGEPGPSKTYQFPILDKPALPAALAEGADLGLPGSGNTQITTSNAQVTAGQVAQKAQVTKLLETVAIIDVATTVGGVLGRGIDEKFETDAAALLAGFSNTTTAAPSTLKIADFLTALAALEQRDVDGQIVAVLHLKQVADLRTEIVASSASFWTEGRNAEGVTGGPYQDGFVGVFFGVPIFQTSLVSSSGGDRRGALFAADEALGCYELWGPTLEQDPDPSSLSTEMVISACYGVGEISDTRGQGLFSDA